MAWVLLAAWVAFYGDYLFRQVWLGRRGVSANRLGRGDKPPRTRALEFALLGVTYGLAGIQLVSVFLSDFMLPIGLPLAVRVVGGVLCVSGAVVFCLATSTMRDNWRAGVDASQKTDMVTRGVYGFCRNPAFLGFDLLYIGSALACPNVVLLIAAPVGVLLLHLQILEEERYLAKAFGEDYARYRAGVKRYCPWF